MDMPSYKLPAQRLRRSPGEAEVFANPASWIKHVVSAGVKAGFNADLASWTGPAIALAVDETRAFESRPAEVAAKKDVA